MNHVAHSGAQRALAAAVGFGRAATGAAFVVAPGSAAQSWVGSSSTDVAYLTRVVGGRDLVIGGGALWALSTGRPVVGWLAASVGADIVDAAAAAVMLEGDAVKRSLLFGLGFAVLGATAIGTVAGS